MQQNCRLFSLTVVISNKTNRLRLHAGERGWLNWMLYLLYYLPNTVWRHHWRPTYLKKRNLTSEGRATPRVTARLYWQSHSQSKHITELKRCNTVTISFGNGLIRDKIFFEVFFIKQAPLYASLSQDRSHMRDTLHTKGFVLSIFTSSSENSFRWKKNKEKWRFIKKSSRW